MELDFDDVRDCTKNHSHAPHPSVVSSPIRDLPAVFIFPPPEEQGINPPWCFLDSKPNPQGSMNHEDLQFIDVALNVLQQTQRAQSTPDAPIFSRNEKGSGAVMPKRGESARMSGSAPWLQEDPQVAQVMRPRDDETAAVPEKPVKPSNVKTLKSRASRAFRSIRSVGIGPTHVQTARSHESVALPESQLSRDPESVESPPLSPTQATSKSSRRSSSALSQLFQSSSKRSSVRLSTSSLNATPPSSQSGSISEPASPAPLSPEDVSPAASTPSMPRSSSPRRPYAAPAADLDPPRARKLSRFSAINLQHLFSPPSSSSPSGPPPTPANTPIIASAAAMTRDSSTSSTPSTATDNDFGMPPTPVDEGFPAIPGKSSSQENRKGADSGGNVPRLETRLDPFQFDSISLDLVLEPLDGLRA